MRALVKNAADRGQVRAGAKVERLREITATADMQHVLMTAEGRRVLWRILSECGMFATPFSTDPHVTYHAIGRADVGRWLVTQIQDTDINAYPQMQREAAQLEREEQLSAEQTQKPRDEDTDG
jgi:hypothetical protein